MTPTDKSLVQQTFPLVVPIADKTASIFYDRLFKLDPALKSLFNVDMREQGRKLMQMIALAVGKLDALDELVPVVEALGARHAVYGVRERDYDTVGTALLWTLEQGLGAAFTPEVRSAWTAVYGVLASTMKAGAAKSAAA